MTRKVPSGGAFRLTHDRMWRRQEFLSTSRDIDTNSMGGKLWESANRLRMIAQQIDSRISSVSADQRPGLLQASEADAAAAIDSFCAVTAEIDTFIARQQTVIDERKLQVASAVANIV